MPFLDVLVKRRDRKLTIDIYSKPTDTHQYLDHSSCHRNHVKKGVPYGQALRLRRICDSDEVFQERSKEMKGHFIKREFKRNLIDSQFEMAKGKNRDGLLHRDIRSKDRIGTKMIPLVMNFHPALSGMGNIIDSLWPILQDSDDTRRIFGEKPMIAFRRPKNLKDDLMRAKLKVESIVDKGVKKCSKSRCQEIRKDLCGKYGDDFSKEI